MLVPDLPYPTLHQAQWLASKTIATIAAPLVGTENAKNTISQDPSPPPRTPHTPQISPPKYHFTAKTPSRDTSGFRLDFSGCCLKERAAGTEEELETTGGSQCGRPFEAKQRRHGRSMPPQPVSSSQAAALPLSSSPSWFLPLPVFLRSPQVYFSNS